LLVGNLPYVRLSTVTFADTAIISLQRLYFTEETDDTV